MSTTVKLTHKRAHCYVPVKSHRIWNCHTPNHNLVAAMIFPSPTDGNQNSRRILLKLVNAIPTTSGRIICGRSRPSAMNKCSLLLCSPSFLCASVVSVLGSASVVSVLIADGTVRNLHALHAGDLLGQLAMNEV